LRWSDIDLDGGKLAIRRTLVAVGYEIQWSEPKTERSRRVVARDPVTVTALRAHRVEQVKERLALGEGYRDDDLRLREGRRRSPAPAVRVHGV
jgi:integrase